MRVINEEVVVSVSIMFTAAWSGATVNIQCALYHIKSPDTRDLGRPLLDPLGLRCSHIAALPPKLLLEDFIVYHIIILENFSGLIPFGIALSRPKHKKMRILL